MPAIRAGQRLKVMLQGLLLGLVILIGSSLAWGGGAVQGSPVSPAGPATQSAPALPADPWAVAEQRAGIYADCGQNAQQLLNGWIELKRDPETHLYSRDRQWDYHNEAADHYSSLVFIAQYVEPALLEGKGTLHQTLANSIRICTTPSGLPGPYDFKTKTLGEPNVNRLTEWLRDGLIRISGALGKDNDFYRELVRLTDAVLTEARRQGGIAKVIHGPEAEGNMMETLARLAIMSGDEKYARAAEEMADPYLLDDPLKKITTFTCVDHGCELVPGLGEVFIMEARLNRPKAEAYREPMRRLLDRLLEVGRHPESGLWYRKVDLSGKPVPNQGRPTKAKTLGVGGAEYMPDVPDTWGYVLFTYDDYDRATGEHGYKDAIEKPMRWLVANRPRFEELKNTLWTPTFNRNTWSDSYECMVALWNRYRDVPGVFEWLDWMTIRGGLRTPKGPFGPGEGLHDDGTTGRCLCRHMMVCSQGIRAVPFQKGLGCGAIQVASGELWLVVSSEAAWKGRLCFDWPRNEFPAGVIDWARIVEMPQWYVVRPERNYRVTIDASPARILPGSELIRGLELSLSAGLKVRMRVTPQ